MFGMSPKDTWLWGLVLLSAVMFGLTARLPERLTGGRAAIICSVGVSVGFVLLALVSGFAVLR